MTVPVVPPERAKARIDQWLWFARLVKSRSLAARLCAAGSVTINGLSIKKPNQGVRIGDVIEVRQGGRQHTVRVVALGMRRGPAAEARLLFHETAAVSRAGDAGSDWIPLLGENDPADHHPPA